MLFEYDDAKSCSNKDKHDIDFVEAQALWLDEKRQELFLLDVLGTRKRNFMNNKPVISSQELDKIFDEGEEDIIEYLDFSTARRPGLEENKITENYQETIQNTKGNSLIISLTMLLLISYFVLVLGNSLFLDLDNEENTDKQYV